MTASPDDATAIFERQRRALRGLAYRMLGSMSEANDIVQEAYLRWRAAVDERGDEIGDARAFLFQVVTRLCLDHLKSARARRERYVGPWLPEPIVEEGASDAAGELAADLSVALLLLLERLSPAERAAFLLHDVFEMEFGEIAGWLGRSEEACRQLASRARARVRLPSPRRRPSEEECRRLVTAFLTAASRQDTAALRALCAEDAVLHSDGGGRVPAALKPVVGADRIARFVVGTLGRHPLPPEVQLRPTLVNGLAGIVIETEAGVIQTFAFEEDEAGLIRVVYIMRNPEKLAHLAHAGHAG